MDAEELLVHDCSKREGAERFHASIVDGFGVLVLAFELEGEVVGQVAAFMVASEEPEGIGIPDLERPKVQHALEVSAPSKPVQQSTYLDAEVTSINVVA